MKNTLVFLILSVALFAYSQGTVDFHNRDTANGVNAPIAYTNSPASFGPVPNGAKPGWTTNISSDGYQWGGTNALAGLYAGPNGSTRDQLSLLAPAVGFFSGVRAGYVNPGSDSMRYVVGVPGGALATFQVRAWDTGSPGVDSYENAVAISLTRKVYLGESPLLNNVLLGNYVPPGGTPTLAASLTGLQGFAMDYVGVPEPSTIALSVLGAIAGIAFFRRR